MTGHFAKTQTLIGAVGPQGYSDHTIELFPSGPVTVELAWSAPDGHLTLFARRLVPARTGSVVLSDRPDGTRQEVSIDIGPREPFVVVVQNRSDRTQAYVITISMA